MTKLKKTSRWIITGFVGLAVLVTALILMADRIIKQEQILSKIQAGVSQAVGGQVKFHRLDLVFFPRPNIVMHQVSFSIPKTAGGNVDSLALYPRFLPLLTGNIFCSRIDLKTPDIKVQLSEKPISNENPQHPSVIAVVPKNIGSVLTAISSKTPGLDVFVENGRLDFVSKDNTNFELNDIHARIDFPPDTVNLNLRFKCKWWENIFLKASIHSTKTKSVLTLSELKLDPLGFNSSGKLVINHPLQALSSSFDLEIKSLDMDVRSVRKLALDLAAGTPVVQDIFDILKAGRVPFITFTSHGNSLKDLGRLDNINIQGRMLDGEIWVPKVNLDLTHVNGDVVISKGILQGRHLETHLGNSQGRQGSLRLGLQGKEAPFHLDVTIDADLTRLPPLLSSLIDNDSFDKELSLVKVLEGNATGRLIMGERLSSFETVVEVSDFKLSANYRRLPYLLNLQGGRFTYKNGKVMLTNTSGRMRNSHFSGLSLELDIKNAFHIDLKAEKSTLSMDEIYPWLFSFDTLKNKLQKFKPPKGILSLAALRLQGPALAPEKWRFQTEGELALKQGPNISAVLSANPDGFILNKLIINDSESNAAVRLASANRTFDLSFRGNLNKATLDKLMDENPILKGQISGDFSTHVLLDHFVQSTVQGRLQVKTLLVPWEKNTPLVINSLTLNTKKDQLFIESAKLLFGDSRVDLKGNLNFSVKGLNFDMDVSADHLKVDNLKQILAKKTKEKHAQADQKAGTYPVRGHLKLKTEKMTYAGLTWSPFYGDVTINDDIATVAVINAKTCDISTPGSLKISPQGISFNIKPAAQDQRLYSTVNCLLDKSVKVDGSFNFNGNITGQGADKDLLGSTNGDFIFTAEKGRFYSGRFHGILVRIVRLLSVTEIFRGKLPDIGRQGFGYNSIKVKADIINGKIRFNEMMIDGTSMNITVRGNYDLTNKQVNCVALVSPLKTIDAIFKKIPVVKDILGGSLFSIPYSIKGPIENPEIKLLSPSQVDSESLEIMQRSLQKPVQVIRPDFFKEQLK